MAPITLSARNGQSITFSLYLNGTLVSAGLAMTEIGTTGEFYADMPTGTAAGEYLVVFFDGAQKIASGVLNWDGAQEVPAVWTYIIEAGYSAMSTMRLMASVLVGKVSGAGTGTETFRDLNDTKDRVISSVDANGNRTDVTKDGT